MTERIELDGGTVTNATVVTAKGAYVDPAHIGQLRFYVSHKGPNGEWYLWDGSSYDDAIVIAEKARRMFGITEAVRDRVVGGGE